MRNTNFNTTDSHNKYNILNKMYDKLIREALRDIDEEDEIRWETYDLIMYELKRECNYKTYDEIRYRITDGENPNEVFLDIIHRGDYSSSLIWLFKRRIEDYLEEDSYNRFFK